MAINTTEDANRYYQIVNDLVDKYIVDNKIMPSKLKNYLKPGGERFNRFLERNKLKDIKGSEVILKDVIDDRASMESDGVFTFESFKLYESNEFKIHSMKQCLYKGIDKSNIEMEKVLADYFDTNLGSIDVVDSDKHIFEIEEWEGEKRKVVIYSGEELMVIKFNILEFVYSELSKQKVKITDSIEIELDSLIDYDLFISKSELRFDNDMIIKLIEEILGEFYYQGNVNDFFIWISN